LNLEANAGSDAAPSVAPAAVPDVVPDVVPDAVADVPPNLPPNVPPNAPPNIPPNSVPLQSPAAPEALVVDAPKRGSWLGIALTALIGGAIVVALSFDILEQKVPYLLGGVDTVLDSNIRYKSASPLGVKDWHNDFLVEQNIWTTEVNKIKLGLSGAKPEAFKRDYLLYLAESYFRDDPHFMEAKATYMAAAAEPRVQHEKGYDLTDAEINRKLAYCCLRLGQYAEAEAFMAKARAEHIQTDKSGKPGVDPNGAFALDLLTECALRQNKLEQAKALLKERLAALQIKDPHTSVEQYYLFNNALLNEKEGNVDEAETFYKKAIAQLEIDDKNRGASVGNNSDNNRTLAGVLRECARFLRSQKRGEESYPLMDRACNIMNNAP
jgi:hypothetical protein